MAAEGAEVLAAATGPQAEAFLPGSIKRIRCKNFMTYSDFEFFPSAGVNFVLGLNGSGKSSLVCAMCVGLNGNLSWMERGNNFIDYVRKGSTEAILEVTLQGTAGREVRIARSIKVTGPGKVLSSWKINGNAASGEEVTKLVQEDFHITLDNPCMFLPQEKIASFTQLEPHELLRRTMSAAGKQLADTYDEALKMQRDQGDRDTSVEIAQRDIKVAADIMEREREAKEVWEERERLSELVRVGELLVPQTNLKKAKADTEEAKRQLEAIMEEGKTLAALTEGPKRRLEAATAAAVEADAQAKAAQEAVKASERVLRTADAKAEALQQKIGAAAATLQSLQNSQEQRAAAFKRALQTAQSQTRAAMAKYGVQEPAKVEQETAASYTALSDIIQAAARPVYQADRVREQAASAEKDALDKEAFRLRQAAQKARGTVATLTQQVTAATAATDAKGRMERERLRAMASSRFPPAVAAYHAHRYVEKYRSQFKGEVYGPILLHMHVADPGYATPLENSIPAWVKFGFVATNKEDSKLLSRRQFPKSLEATDLPPPPSAGLEANGPRGQQVSVMQVDRALIAQQIAEGRAKQMNSSWDEEGGAAGGGRAPAAPAGGEPAWLPEARAQLGDCELADRVMRTDDIIMAVLYRECSLGTIAVSKADDASERYFAANRQLLGPGFIFFTPKANIRPRLSRRGELITSRGSCFPSTVLRIQMDEAESARAASLLEDARSRLAAAETEAAQHAASLAQVEARIPAVQAELVRVQAARNETTATLGRLKSAIADLAKAEQVLRSADDSPAEAIAQATQEVLKAHVAHITCSAGPVVAAWKALSASIQRAWAADVGVTAAKAELDAANEAHKESERKSRSWGGRRDAAAQAVKAAAAVESQALVAHRQSVVQLRAVSMWEEKVKSLLERMGVPNQDAVEREALETHISMLRARYSHLAAEEGAVARYREAKAKFEEATRKLHLLTQNRQEYSKQLLEKQTSWYRKMSAVVAAVSRGFTTGMAKIAARGHVVLHGDFDATDPDRNDLGKFGIHVMVSFHEDQDVQRLTSLIQSGGERAVATMMYLLSLQPVTRLPFRVMDEINQGVDATNERFLMEELVALASSQGQAAAAGASASSSSAGAAPEPAGLGRQLFIISPKLLRDLKHHEDMRTTVIFNGPFAGASLPAAQALGSYFSRAVALAGSKRGREDDDDEEESAPLPARRRARN